MNRTGKIHVSLQSGVRFMRAETLAASVFAAGNSAVEVLEPKGTSSTSGLLNINTPHRLFPIVAVGCVSTGLWRDLPLVAVLPSTRYFVTTVLVGWTALCGLPSLLGLSSVTAGDPLQMLRVVQRKPRAVSAQTRHRSTSPIQRGFRA